jgi:hypothetical protein
MLMKTVAGSRLIQRLADESRVAQRTDKNGRDNTRQNKTKVEPNLPAPHDPGHPLVAQPEGGIANRPVRQHRGIEPGCLLSLDVQCQCFYRQRSPVRGAEPKCMLLYARRSCTMTSCKRDKLAHGIAALWHYRTA